MLAFDAETGRQHILYSDGEDERLLLHQESVQWHELQTERRCYTVGLPEGVSAPQSWSSHLAGCCCAFGLP